MVLGNPKSNDSDADGDELELVYASTTGSNGGMVSLLSNALGHRGRNRHPLGHARQPGAADGVAPGVADALVGEIAWNRNNPVDPFCGLGDAKY